MEAPCLQRSQTQVGGRNQEEDEGKRIQKQAAPFKIHSVDGPRSNVKDKAGLDDDVLALFVARRKALHRQAMLEEQLEDAAKAHELALLRQRESKSFIVGAMGASSARSLLLVYITAWRAYLVQGCTKARLEHQIETSLHRACLAFHTIHEKHTKVVAMKEWNKIASEIRLERWKAELETTNGLAEHMRRLHAGPVRKKLFQLFDADNGTLVQAVFYVWK
eukprot:CAMPEP_0169187614 /NCGR_PEP_ID=MMETSP1016-20121227/3017_1 /TAXON_ID=342587 /ORGANISM="Karlodinium micrum, Strain CCMP2283" /LENGTH=219 /DNA_ID=CAMNT_0009263583 /DNA_START=159 /DNA_END=816 /DNA_ORIENTATION=+